MHARWLLVLALGSLMVASAACSDDAGNNPSGPQCSDGVDNDNDGMTDFPDDLGCDGPDDETEDDNISPECKDGRDNDGDGKTDFPNDPGCFAPQQNSEEDDCPDGPGCPQCANGIDDDMNGQTDFPNDSGCTSASDIEEYTSNPFACGNGTMAVRLPLDGKASGTLMAGAPSQLMSSSCGGSGAEDIYEIRVNVPKVIVASTQTAGTNANTVLYLRSENCVDPASELTCNDDVSLTVKQSTITEPVLPGTYYLVVDAKDALGGPYELEVQFFVGEGTACQVPDECGPGLVCRVPKGGTTKICQRHICEDGVDDDDDGLIDYPNDPGCDSPTDDDESDNCPAGPDCPECADGIDNDGDGLIDYGPAGDPTCSAASSASEACVSSDGVAFLTQASTMDTTVGAVNDVKVACATSGTHTAPDKTYRLDLPAMATLTINNVNSFDAAVAFYDSTCAGTPIKCGDEPENITMTNLAAGTYYYTVDGYSTSSGAYTINVSGRIQAGQSCESALAQAGAITCDTGYACVGSTGSRTCQPAACFDGDDNDNDGKIDFPLDPGCDSPGDTSEANPNPLPACANNVDDDGDGQTDYPNDYGCGAASGTSEVFCMAEADPTARITTKTVTGTTTGLNNNFNPSCGTLSHTATDAAYALQLPVPVTTLVVDTLGSSFDTTVHVRTIDCVMELGCNDQGGTGFGNTSKLELHGLPPGGYAIVVDGWSSGNGNYTLNVQGTVAPGTVCNSSLFSGGANAVLVCPAGTTCTGNPVPRCQ